jgi:hypothetical protein
MFGLTFWATQLAPWRKNLRISGATLIKLPSLMMIKRCGRLPPILEHGYNSADRTNLLSYMQKKQAALPKDHVMIIIDARKNMLANNAEGRVWMRMCTPGVTTGSLPEQIGRTLSHIAVVPSMRPLVGGCTRKKQMY